MDTTLPATAAARPANAALRRFAILLHASFATYIRSRMVLFWIIAFPIGLMLLFGAIYGNMHIDPSDPTSLTLISILAPGMLVLSLMSNGIIGNASAMARYRELGILRRIQTTPLPLWQLLLARILMQSALMVGQGALVIGTSIVLFGARYDAWGLLAAVPAVILGAVVFMAIGQAIAALVSKADTVQIVSQVIYFPLMFLGGLTLPLSQLPDWLQTIGKWLPSTMIADLVRTPMLASLHVDPIQPLAFDLLGLLVYLVVAVGVSVRFFHWD